MVLMHRREVIVAQTCDQREARSELVTIHYEAADDVLVHVDAVGASASDVREACSGRRQSRNQVD